MPRSRSLLALCFALFISGCATATLSPVGPAYNHEVNALHRCGSALALLTGEPTLVYRQSGQTNPPGNVVTGGRITAPGEMIADGRLTVMNCDATYSARLQDGLWVFDPLAQPPHVPDQALPDGPLAFFVEHNGVRYGRYQEAGSALETPLAGARDSGSCRLYDWSLYQDFVREQSWDPTRCPDGAVNGLPAPDQCPYDPLKTEPGLCGCGQPDGADVDGDGRPACMDGEPEVASEPGKHAMDFHLFMRGVGLDANTHWHKNGVTQCFFQPEGSAYANIARDNWACRLRAPDTWFERNVFWKNYVRPSDSDAGIEMMFLRVATADSHELYRFEDDGMYLDVETGVGLVRTFNEVDREKGFRWGRRYEPNVFIEPQDVTLKRYEPCDAPAQVQRPFNISRIVGAFNISTGEGRRQAEQAMNHATVPSNLAVPSAWYTTIPQQLGLAGDVWLVWREGYWSSFEQDVYSTRGDPNRHFRFEENYDYLCVGPAPDACRSVGIVGWRVKYHPRPDAPVRLLRRTVMTTVGFEEEPILAQPGRCRVAQ